jgi:hypothetical protein
MEDVGPITPLWHRILLTVFGQSDSIRQRICCEFIEQPALSFDEVKSRVWASIERNQEDWIDDEAVAGEGGAPLPLATVLAAAKAAVDKSTSLKDLFENLDAAWPY